MNLNKSDNRVKESRSRSFIKAVSWRVVAFIVLGIISYAVTGSWETTTLITVVYNIVQIGIYFVHERAWARITWGKPDGIETLPHASDLSPEEAAAISARLKELGYIE